METGSADDVCHEGVAGDETTAGQSDREGADIEPIARASPSPGEVAFEDCSEAPLAMTLQGAELVWER